MDTEEFGKMLYGVRDAIAVLDTYEEKEVTEQIGSFSHRITRGNEYQVVDKLQLPGGVLTISFTPTKENPYFSEDVVLEIGNTNVCEGIITFDYRDPKMELQYFKNFEVTRYTDGPWRAEFETTAQELQKELEDFIKESEEAQQKVLDARIQRKLKRKLES